jgi:hypothetical protein
MLGISHEIKGVHFRGDNNLVLETMIYYFGMQSPATVLEFPLFPTLLAIIKKSEPPYPHGLETSDILYTVQCTVVTPCVIPPRYNLLVP